MRMKLTHIVIAASLTASTTLTSISTASASTPPTTSPSIDRWSSTTAMPYALQEVASTALDDYLYVAGGLGLPFHDQIFSRKHLRYSFRTQQWETLADLPVASHHLQAFAIDGKIIYLGGEEGPALIANGRTWQYDPETDVFTELAPMPPGRIRGATGAAEYDGKIYVAGGAKILNFGERQFDVFDPTSNSWSSLPDMPHAREHLGAAVVDGKLYAVGGRNLLPTNYVTPTDVFNLQTGIWEESTTDITHGRGGLGVVAIGSKIYAFGGEGPGISFNDAAVFDTISSSWSDLTDMPLARHGIQAATQNGAIYLAGGAFIGIYGPAADVQIYLP